MKLPFMEIERRKFSYIRFTISFGLLIFGLLLLIAPLLEPPGTVDFGNNGIVGRFEHAQNISHMQNPVSKAIYTFGDWECHQHASRSFFINGNQMPVCARCTGIFLSISFTAFFLIFYRIRMPFWLIILLIVPLGVDGVVQLLTPYESTNLIRLITGALAGFATTVAFDMVIEE